MRTRLAKSWRRCCHLGQRGPLPFFPTTSRGYVEKRRELMAKKPELPLDEHERQALADAREKYSPPEYNRQRGDADDPYVSLLFGDLDPLGTEPGDEFQPFEVPTEELPALRFTELACLVFEPLFNATERDE